MITPINEFEWYKDFEKILQKDYGAIVMDNLNGFVKGINEFLLIRKYQHLMVHILKKAV